MLPSRPRTGKRLARFAAISIAEGRQPDPDTPVTDDYVAQLATIVGSLQRHLAWAQLQPRQAPPTETKSETSSPFSGTAVEEILKRLERLELRDIWSVTPAPITGDAKRYVVEKNPGPPCAACRRHREMVDASLASGPAATCEQAQSALVRLMAEMHHQLFEHDPGSKEFKAGTGTLDALIDHTRAHGMTTVAAKFECVRSCLQEYVVQANTAMRQAVEPNPGPLMDYLRKLRFRLHGYSGGPGYTSREFTENPDWSLPSQDALDEIFKRHDYDYTREDKTIADARMVQRLRSGRFDKITRGNLKAALAAAGFTLANFGLPTAPERDDYPWLRRKRAITTATTAAVEPNPGPPKKGRKPRGGRAKAKAQQRPRPRPSRPAATITVLRRPKPRGPNRGPASRPQGNASRGGVQNVKFTRTDLLYAGTASSSSPAGTTLLTLAINPSGLPAGGVPTLPAQLLNYEAAKWEMFDCQVRFRVKATGASTINGTFTHGIDSDVTDALPQSSIAAIQRLTNQGGSTHTWASGGSTSFNRLNSAKFTNRYFVQPKAEADPRTICKGRYWLIVSEPATSYFAAGSGQNVDVPFQVYADYTFRFSNATLEPATTALTMSGGVDTKGTAGASSSSPLALDSLASNGTIDTDTAPSGGNGTIAFASSGGTTYVGLAINSMWDNVNYALLQVQLIGTGMSGFTPVTSPAALWTGGNASSTSVSYIAMIPLYNAPIALANMTLYATKATGAWVTAGPSQPFPNLWAAVSFAAMTASSITAYRWTLAPFNTYTSTITDRMLQCAGPGTVEHKYVSTWQCDKPLELHLATELRKEQREAKDSEMLAAQCTALQAQVRHMSLGGERYAPSSPPDTPRSEREFKSSKPRSSNK